MIATTWERLTYEWIHYVEHDEHTQFRTLNRNL